MIAKKYNNTTPDTHPLLHFYLAAMVALIPVSGKKMLSGSSPGQLDVSVERAERRYYAEYADTTRSKDSRRFLSSQPCQSNGMTITNAGSDLATSQGRRKQRHKASIKQLFKGAPIRRSKVSHGQKDNASLTCIIPNATVQNDIDNLGKEFELGFGSSVSRSKQECSTSVTKIQSHANEFSSRNNDATTYNYLSTEKDQSSTSSSKERQIQRQRNELKYWSGLSVRVAMAVMQANGSETIAQKVSTIVLAEGRKQSGQKRSSKMMRALSVKLSISVLEAGGDQNIGLAVMNAVMAYENSCSVKFVESSKLDDNSNTDKSKIVSSAQSIAPSVRSNKSMALSTTSSNRSNKSKRNKLQSIEMQILEKQRAIEEAELRNLEREREFNEQMAALEAATKERLAALNATRALLEEEPLINVDNENAQVDESKDSNIEDKRDSSGDDKGNAFQSGIDDFVLGFNEQMAALEVVAKESLAEFDATKEAFLERVGLAQNEYQDIAVANDRNEGKDTIQDDISNKVSAFQSGIDGFVSGFSEQLAKLAGSASWKDTAEDNAISTAMTNEA